MKIVELPQLWSGRALIVADVDDADSWFTPGELAVVRSFPREKRRNEWMLSRIAEKILRQRGAIGSNVSFSHSRPYGAAAVDTHPVGFDVERIRPISENAAHLFLTNEEIAVMQHCTMAHRMLHFWSAKEALWKQHGGAVPTLKTIPLRFERVLPDGLRFASVETYAGSDFIAALTT
jgi:phosphopantetheinyl transferase (holo-ACP synthase)